MTQPVDDSDYAEDDSNVTEDELPEVTDPTSVPSDEGDADAVNKEADQ